LFQVVLVKSVINAFAGETPGSHTRGPLAKGAVVHAGAAPPVPTPPPVPEANPPAPPDALLEPPVPGRPFPELPPQLDNPTPALDARATHTVNSVRDLALAKAM
jgi:hypothetical protein